MAEFKDISQFTVKTPDGTEEVQVSATQKVNLKTVVQKFAPSAGISLSSPLTGFTNITGDSPDSYQGITATTTLLNALRILDRRTKNVIVDYQDFVSNPSLSIIGTSGGKAESIVSFRSLTGNNGIGITYVMEGTPVTNPDDLISNDGTTYEVYTPKNKGASTTIAVDNPAGNYYTCTTANLTVQGDKDFGTAIVRTPAQSMNITSTSSTIRKCEGFDDVIAKTGLKIITMFAMDANVYCNVALYK